MRFRGFVRSYSLIGWTYFAGDACFRLALLSDCIKQAGLEEMREILNGPIMRLKVILIS
jgi:hypothetical protein